MKTPPVVNSVEDLIGQTPLVKLQRLVKYVPVGRWLKEQMPDAKAGPVQSEVYCKIEYLNPGGSVKDRIAKTIIDGAEKAGHLKPGGTIVECTSGNTGAGLAMIGISRGYKVTLVMPDKISAEKINALVAYGARVVICPTGVEPDHPDSYYEVAKRIARETPGAFHTNQYKNPDNPRAHYETTGPELWAQLGDKLDLYAVAAGTGGTISGAAKFLREKNPKLKVVAIDPYGSLYHGLIKTGKPSPVHTYLQEGYGEDFVPETMDLKCPDEVVQVGDAEAFSCTRMLAEREGILAGGSSGAAIFGLLSYLRAHELKGGKPLKAVAIISDSGRGYLSKIFNKKWLEDNKMAIEWGAEKTSGFAEFLPSAKKIPGV